MSHKKVTLDKIYQFETGMAEGRRKERERIIKIIDRGIDDGIAKGRVIATATLEKLKKELFALDKKTEQEKASW